MRDEIAARLRIGGVALAFDTNAIWSPRRLTKVCDDIKRHNEHVEAAGRAPVRLLVSTIAHAEKLFDLKQQWSDRFDLTVILACLHDPAERPAFGLHGTQRRAPSGIGSRSTSGRESTRPWCAQRSVYGS